MRQPNMNILRPWWRPLKASSGSIRAGWQHHPQMLLDDFGLVAGVLLLICAMLWAVGENSRQKADLRMAETNRYIAAFQGPPVADAWRRLRDVWHAQQGRQSALLRRIAKLSGAALQAELHNYRAFVIDVVVEHRLPRDINTMIRFYRRLASCIRIGSCDADLAAGLFGRNAWSFRNQHYYYLQDEYQVDEIDRVIEVIAPHMATSGVTTLS